jgi:predicted ribosomally synthesized peptide with nif11-like leader
MSKDNVFQFLTEAAQQEQLKKKLQAVKSQEDLVSLGKELGYEFSADHIDEALAYLKNQPGFFSKLADAVLSVFSPSHDDVPAIGFQPYSGDTNE